MIIRKILFRLLSVLMGLAVSILCFEFGAYITLKMSPSYRFSFKPKTKSVFSKYELPESLSLLPIVKTKKTPKGPLTTKLVMDIEDHQGLLIPPKSKRFKASFINGETGALIWASQITTDEHARRRTQSDSKNSEVHIVGLGGSRAWGHGVDDDETILAYLAKILGNTSTYNVAFEGYGPADNLVRIKDEEALQNIVPQKGFALYFYFPDHYYRFVNSARKVGTWRPRGLVLKETSVGQFLSEGPISEVSPTRVFFSKLIARDSLLQLFDFDWPLENQTDTERMVRVFNEMKTLYQKETRSKNSFVVVLLPNQEVSDTLRAALDRAAISFIDYSMVDLDIRLQGPRNLPGDPHPPPEVNQKIAQALSRDLKELIN